jgi:sugar phosphate permease
MAMASLNFGLFIKPMGDDLGIGRSTFGWAFTARQITTSATSPIVGSLLDRFGARVILPVSAAVTGAAMIGLGYTDHAWQLVLMLALMGVVGMSGPGALVTSVPVMKWFVRNRGKAVSFMSLGIPIGAIVFVPLTQIFIDAWGWRQAWIGLAIIGVAVIVPLAVMFVRRQPEDLGLKPDGAGGTKPPTGGRAGRAVVHEEVSWTSREATRSGVFWRLVVIFSVSALGVGVVGVHRIPAFMDRGLDARLVSYATAFDAVCAGASTFTMGMLVAKLPARYLGAVGFLLLASASVLTIYANSVFIMALSMAIFGLGIGGTMFLQNFLWADYFGRTHLGRIRGIVNPITLTIGGIGAPLAGYVRDSTGSYDSIWWAGVGLMLIGAIALAFTRAPTRGSMP